MRNLFVALLVIAAATAAQAEIAIFADGRTLRVTAWQPAEETMQLTLASGGLVTVPITRIERIIDDEVIEPEPVPATSRAAGWAFPQRSWRFSERSQPIFQSRFNDTIIAAAKKFDVDAALVSAVIKAESDYDPKVVSHKGARGLMQLMPGTAKRFGVSNSFDPVENIYGGTRYLRWLLDKFDSNADLAVAAYNAGEGNVWKYKGVPPFRETTNYVKRISRYFQPTAASSVAEQTASR